MSNLENILKMLFELKKGNIVKKKDLANKLAVTEKQVLRYKNAISELFTIESIPGPNGGYKMIDLYFPFKELLTKEEIILLKMHINSCQYNDIESEKLKRALEKINYTILKDTDNISAQMIPYSKINVSNKDILTIKKIFYEAILNHQQIIIEYTGNYGANTKRTIEPYKLIIFKGEWYIASKCLLRNDIRFFKLIRIKNYIVTSKRFKIDNDVDKLITEYRKNSIGIFGGKEYDIELEITPPIANTIKERIWVDNQIIEELNNGKILFKARMNIDPEIISWIFSMKSSVKIIKPEILKKEVKCELKKMIENL
ncbi:putative DNA-binding transcriptional regulator YafY [Clostridium moniliforme]|uniref:DNA-binding transcriptional regulator YafY n=1 Tax=Clostridium moniliforme TaxID=39489 RepID=A0ABS4F294_9CLOT|nr:WYL domain-containing transcriptional regulator [Clostridium moniliforme]MBP1890376.1 putative DNA-binding transcriptional regulator YafY [Clostridium moniliforme]